MGIYSLWKKVPTRQCRSGPARIRIVIARSTVTRAFTAGKAKLFSAEISPSARRSWKVTFLLAANATKPTDGNGFQHGRLRDRPRHRPTIGVRLPPRRCAAPALRDSSSRSGRITVITACTRFACGRCVLIVLSDARGKSVSCNTMRIPFSTTRLRRNIIIPSSSSSHRHRGPVRFEFPPRRTTMIALPPSARDAPASRRLETRPWRTDRTRRRWAGSTRSTRRRKWLSLVGRRPGRKVDGTATRPRSITPAGTIVWSFRVNVNVTANDVMTLLEMFIEDGLLRAVASRDAPTATFHESFSEKYSESPAKTQRDDRPRCSPNSTDFVMKTRCR